MGGLLNSERTGRVLADVLDERAIQDAKWGEQNHATGEWFKILLEELGEAAEADLTADWEQYRRKLISVAAVAVAAVEGFDRQTEQELAELDQELAELGGENDD